MDTGGDIKIIAWIQGEIKKIITWIYRGRYKNNSIDTGGDIQIIAWIQEEK